LRLAAWLSFGLEVIRDALHVDSWSKFLRLDGCVVGLLDADVHSAVWKIGYEYIRSDIVCRPTAVPALASDELQMTVGRTRWRLKYFQEVCSAADGCTFAL